MAHSMGLDRRKLYQQIADDIEQLILEGAFPPDSRLPSEQELADRYGVSRNVIREALKSLHELGLVAIKTGSGSYVCRPTTHLISAAFDRFLRFGVLSLSPEHFNEIRQMVEPNGARLAAERANEQDLQAIQVACEALEAYPNDHRARLQADAAFHLAIANATHNPLLLSILDPLIELYHKVIAEGRLEAAEPEPGLEVHQRIAEAIRSRDPDRAYAAMLAHVNGLDGFHRDVI